MTLLKQTILLVTLALSAGCVHKINVIQGNYLDDETIAKVKQGMTTEQVRFVLGDPVLEDSFSKDSWEYLYYLRIGRTKSTRKERLTLHFEDGKVSKIQRYDAEPAPPAI